jgi:hypothetical protein
LLHAGIRPVLNIPGFGAVMCATYLTFLDADEVAALLGLLDPRAWFARLGLRRPNLEFLRGSHHPLGIPAWQQLEFAFDHAECQAGAEPMAAA